MQANQLAEGHLEISSTRDIELSRVRQPVLIVSGDTDVIAPVECVHRAVEVLTGSREVTCAASTGSHLGVLAGPTARDTTWTHIAAFLAQVAD